MATPEDRLNAIEGAMSGSLLLPNLQSFVEQGQCTPAQADRLEDISARLSTCESKLFRKLQLKPTSTPPSGMTISERLEAVEAKMFRLLSGASGQGAAKTTTQETKPCNHAAERKTTKAEEPVAEKKRPALTRKPSKIQAFLEAEAIRAALQEGNAVPSGSLPPPAPMPEPTKEAAAEEVTSSMATAAPTPAPAKTTAPRTVSATEASYGMSTAEHHSFNASTSMSVDKDCSSVFKKLKTRRKHRYIFYGIAGDLIATSELGKRSATFEDFLKALPEADCRYVVYDHEYKTKDGRLADKLLFITWCPAPAPTTVKMLYTTERPRVSPWITGALELTASSSGDIKDFLGVEDADDNESDEDWMDN